MNTTSYHTKPATSDFWRKVQAEREAARTAQGNALKAYNAARKEWEANGKQGRQPSLVDFQAQ